MRYLILSADNFFVSRSAKFSFVGMGDVSNVGGIVNMKSTQVGTIMKMQKKGDDHGIVMAASRDSHGKTIVL
jgi:hypothetical protein